MENFNITQRDTTLRIDGFPDALKVVGIDGPQAKRLADLALHKADLGFAESCLTVIPNFPEELWVVREALWRSAIVHVLKCFGNSASRFQLSAKQVLKGEPPEGMVVFAFFKDLRDKHLVHDANSYSQSIPGAVLNKGDKDYKIEKIVCFAATAVTLDQGSYDNLRLLVAKTQSWVTKEFDALCTKLTIELEKKSHAELCAKRTLQYRAPTVEELKTKRNPIS